MNVHIVGPEDSVANDGFEVWLERPQEGLCIGVGPSKSQAIADAARELMRVVRRLRELLRESQQLQ